MIASKLICLFSPKKAALRRLRKSAPSFCLRDHRFFAAYTFGALFLASPEFKFYLLYRKKARSVNQNAPAAAYFHIFAQPSIFFISENTLLSIREICTCDTPITSATSLCVMSRKYRKTMILRSRSGSSASAVFNCR